MVSNSSFTVAVHPGPEWRWIRCWEQKTYANCNAEQEIALEPLKHMVWGWWFAFTEFMISVIGMRSFYDGDDLKMGIIPITIHYPIVWNFCIAHRSDTNVQNCVWQYCVKCKKIVQLKYVMGYRNFEIFVFEMTFGGIFYFATWPQHLTHIPLVMHICVSEFGQYWAT